MRITKSQAEACIVEHGSPVYLYDGNTLRQAAEQLMNLQLPFGLTVRYAVKANPHPEIVGIFGEAGLHFDASSSYEAANLLSMGIVGDRISLSSQQPAHNLPELLQAGVRYVATSMHQLELFADNAPRDARVALRVNTGNGSGHNNRTTTAGIAASFGLWHEYLDDALYFAHGRGIAIDRLHTHIGSGADPMAWAQAMDRALAIVERMPDVIVLDIGGGYKVHRFGSEQETDMQAVAATFSERLTAFAARTGRRIHLEIEPGTWLVAHAGTLLAQVADIVDTGASGYVFLRVNTGMNDFMRPTLYGAQHTIRVFGDTKEKVSSVVVGHNCESGDILTPAPGNPELLMPRRLNRAKIGDVVAIEDVGAYCASLRAIGYNAYPPAPEVICASGL